MNEKEVQEVRDLIDSTILGIYNKGILSGQEHAKPSQETLSLINSLKIDMAEEKKDITFIKEKIGNIEETLENFISKADERYASKLTEKIVYILCGMILLAFATQIIALIIK